LNIVSRANESSAGYKIVRAGADNVVSPFDSAGQQIASEILKATGRVDSTSEMPGSPGLAPKWITIESGSGMIHQSIQELSFEMQRPVIGLRRDHIDHLEPDKTTMLQEGDQILVLDEIGQDVTVIYTARCTP
jgi:voltage-gated potassium channel